MATASPSLREPCGDWRIARRDAEGVRLVRKTCKQARARLRLAEDAGIAGAKTLRRQIAQVAQELAPIRDTAVAGVVAQKILAEPHHAGRLARFPKRERSPAWWTARQKELTELERELAEAGLRPLSAQEVRRGLRHSFRRVRKAARAAKAKPSFAALHAWRKKATLLRDQIALAAPLLGKRAENLQARLHALTKRLGRATDCRALIEAMEGDARPLVPQTLQRELEAGMKKIKRRSAKRARKLWPTLKRRLRRSLG